MNRLFSDATEKAINILVVDDEPVIASLLTRQLKLLGHDATSVTDPREAVKIVSNDSFDLVISDRSMPQMSGDDLAEAVRSLAPDTKFAMASGYGDLMIANDELPAGVDLILPKPVSNDSLKEALDTLFPASSHSVALVG